MLASFIVGIALFFEVGLVLLLPIIAEIGLALNVPLLYVGMYANGCGPDDDSWISAAASCSDSPCAEPPIAMIISVLFAIYSMGIRQHRSTDEIEKTVARAIRQIAMLLLIIGAGGALKQASIRPLSCWLRDGQCVLRPCQ